MEEPEERGRYPIRLRISIPTAGIDLQMEPPVAAQEPVTEGSTGVTYREGAVDDKGSSAGRPVHCEGCSEMTGFAGSPGGLF